MATKDSFGFQGKWLMYLTHHSPTCRVVLYPHLGKHTALERSSCDCGAFKGQYSRELIEAKNIVTTAGSVFYMQQITNGSFPALSPTVAAITNAFNTLELGSAGNLPAVGNDRSDITAIGSTQTLPTTAYPFVNDTDADNTGAGAAVLTWTFNYTAASFTAASITDAIITNASPGASEPIACHFDETTFTPSGAFAKTSSDTLKMIYNVTGAAPP